MILSMGIVSMSAASPSGVTTMPRFVFSSAPRATRDCVVLTHSKRCGGAKSLGTACMAYAWSTVVSAIENGVTMQTTLGFTFGKLRGDTRLVMTKAKQIRVYASWSQDDLENHGAQFEQICDTIKEAKAVAKNVLTTAYARSGEMKEPFGYSQVVVNGEVLHDYFK